MGGKWPYEVLREFRKIFRRKKPAFFKSDQWHFRQDNAPIYNSILVTDDLSKMDIKTVPQPPCSPDLGPCDFWLFPKLRGCRYETIEEMKEAVTKVIDMLTQENFQGWESVRDDERCGRNKEVNTLQLIGQTVRVRVTMLRF